MRYIAAVVMVLLAGVAVLAPAPAVSEPGASPGSEPPPVATCPLRAGAGRDTDVSIVSSGPAAGQISTFASGEAIGSLDFETGETNSTTIDAAEVGAVGVAGGLIETLEGTTAAGVVVIGDSSRAAEACADVAPAQAFLAGGSTASGAVFELQLLNPYAGEALVDLTVSSEAGIESSDRFNAVRVPALSQVTLDMSEIIPGREEISVNIEVTAGSALGFGRQTTDGQTALWRAVEPVQDWWLPIPEGGGRKQLLLATPTGSEIDYQIDYYGANGLEEAFESGVLAPRGRQRIGLAAISADTAAVRIISTGPVVPTLWIDSDQGLNLTSASPVDASTWLLPGASRIDGGSASMVVLNTGIEDVTVEVIALRPASTNREFTVPVNGVIETGVTPADGYRVEATGPVVVLWTSNVSGAGTVAMGSPIQNG